MVALVLILSAVAGETELEARARLAAEYEAEVGVVLEDGTDCDLLSDRYALDVAFAGDWREAVGQALLCASWSDRDPGVILLRRRPEDATAVWRSKLACQRAGVHLFLEDLRMASVVGRHVFYPGSYYGDTPDPTKSALLPGGTGTFANYISRAVYSGGWVAACRGIYVDVEDLAAPGAITAADFEFRYGNDNDPSGWQSATDPSAVSVAEGAGVGGSDRIKITWADSAMPNSRWLQVTVLANANTGLAIEDVHYWGIAIGETGDNPANAEVTTDDAGAIAANVNPSDPQPITCRYDMDRDGYVLFADVSVAGSNYTSEGAGTALLLITVPPGPVAGPYDVEAGEVFHTGGAAGQSFVAGRQAGGVFHASAVAGQGFVAGHQAGEVFHAGVVAGQVER